jgi:putative endonuclease
MAFVYFLQSQSTGRYYVGSTNDLARRLSDHHRDHTPSTHARGPWTLVDQQSLATLADASRGERQIKSRLGKSASASAHACG